MCAKSLVTLREIMVSTGDNKPETVAAAEKKANLLLTRARGGVDKFADLARQYSDDASATDDGLLPPFERGKLNKAIEDVVFKHEKGYVTDLIQIRGIGFEFFKVEDHTAEGQASLDDVKGQINNILTRPIADPEAPRVSDDAAPERFPAGQAGLHRYAPRRVKTPHGKTPRS